MIAPGNDHLEVLLDLSTRSFLFMIVYIITVQECGTTVLQQLRGCLDDNRGKPPNAVFFHDRHAITSRKATLQMSTSTKS